MVFLRFEYFNFLYFLIPVFLLLVLYRLKFYKSPIYSYSLASFFKYKNLNKSGFYKKILFSLRFLVLFFLIFLIARPQWVDSNSKVNVEGVDIILAIDISGSMRAFDDLSDKRTRIEVAKSEAIRFIDKRENDPIGIVVFAADAITLCPLTLDKKMLKEIVNQLEIGYLEPDGTFLGTGLAMSVNRLKNSKAKSKIIILLTDGVPNQDKISPEVAVNLAKEFGVKVYTIGVGNEKGGFAVHPFMGLQQIQDSLDIKLLEKIAKETGGHFFRADNPKQLREIYDKINSLEKTEYQTNIFYKYYEAFKDFIWFILLILFLELFLKLFIWRSICH